MISNSLYINKPLEGRGRAEEIDMATIRRNFDVDLQWVEGLYVRIYSVDRTVYVCTVHYLRPSVDGPAGRTGWRPPPQHVVWPTHTILCTGCPAVLSMHEREFARTLRSLRDGASQTAHAAEDANSTNEQSWSMTWFPFDCIKEPFVWFFQASIW